MNELLICAAGLGLSSLLGSVIGLWYAIFLITGMMFFSVSARG